MRRETRKIRCKIQFYDKFYKYCDTFLEMMEEFKAMLYGHLGRIITAKFQI